MRDFTYMAPVVVDENDKWVCPPWLKAHWDAGGLPSAKVMTILRNDWLHDHPEDRAEWDEFDRKFREDLLLAVDL